MLSPGHLLLCSLISQLTHKAGMVLHIHGEAAQEEDSTVHAAATQAGVTTEVQYAPRHTALPSTPSHSLTQKTSPSLPHSFPGFALSTPHPILPIFIPSSLLPLPSSAPNSS